MNNTDKVAIVTGAAQGIGEAIALRLGRDGFNVVIADLPSNSAAANKVSTAVKALGVKSAVIEVDVSKKAQVDALVESTVEQLGRLDVMVANAGIAPVGPLLDITEEVLDRLVAVNVKGVLFCYQAAARQMLKQGKGGRLIAASSTAGIRGYAGFSAYSMTKFAVRSLNQSASQELGPHGINCNVYCPSPVDTPMWTKCDQDIAAMTGTSEGDISREKAKENPLGRLVQPEDVAKVVSFFAGPDSSFINGESMLVNGGESLQ